MKKTIIISLIIFGIVLIIAILCVALSLNGNEVQENKTYNISTESVTIITLNDTITFTAKQVPELIEKFNSADILALNSETYRDSSIVIPLGKIGEYTLDYHYTYVLSTNAKIHSIVIHDAIKNKEVYVSRHDKFINNISTYREMLYDTIK